MKFRNVLSLAYLSNKVVSIKANEALSSLNKIVHLFLFAIVKELVEKLNNTRLKKKKVSVTVSLKVS